MAFFRHNMTRRAAVRAAAAAGAGVAAASLLDGCADPAERALPSEPVLVDDDEVAVVTGEDGDFEYVDAAFEPMDTWILPLGNVVHPGEGAWLPVTTAGASATPMVKGSALNTANGELVELVSEPVGADANRYVIYDVSCSDRLYAWVELDVQTRGWALYVAPMSDGKLAAREKVLYEADGSWSPPRMAVSGERILWQVMPTVGGAHTEESSYAYLWQLGEDQARSVVESPGRFATPPAVSGDTITLVPRVRADEGVYYGVTAYAFGDDLESLDRLSPIDRLVMPRGIRPFYAVRLGERFAISVEASYSSGGLLGQMGTYFGVADGALTRVPLEPFANVAGTSRGRCVVKSRASYYVVDLEKKTYSVLGAANRCVDYGEYPARVGLCSSFVTYSTVKDADTGYPTEVVVRNFAL